MKSIGVGIIGSGAIALANHLPGLALCPNAKLVALCDSDERTLAEAARQTGVSATYTNYRDLLGRDDVHAVIIATPNYVHPETALAAVSAGKHVLCEKPLALELSTALEMYRAAEAGGIRHMTAFTYRFVPAMRYMAHLIRGGALGVPYHFRAQRFQDWGDRPLGWRQVKKLAGTGEMADMLSHRIDYAHLLVGPTRRLVADLRTLVPERGGRSSDVDDWVGMLSELEGGVSGVLESTKLATGRGEGYGGQDTVEVNGSEGSLVYSTQRPNELGIARKGDTELKMTPVPADFLVWPGSPRDPSQGDPRVAFRYDQGFEFVDAIANDRPCVPSFKEGVMAQAVMDAAVQSMSERRWVDVKQVD